VFGNSRYVSADTWHDSQGRPFQPQSHYFVGGATKLYGAALFRLRPSDFEERQLSDGISPAWPLSYKEFEPWYSAAEQMYGVRGHHGEDPTEGPWSKQYAYPAIHHEPRIQQLSDELELAGYHPFHAPAGVLPQKGCTLCATCDGFPCQPGAKADAETVAVRPVMNLPNVTLMTNAEVTQLYASSRTVTHAEITRNGEREHHSADIIVLAAGAVNSAKILLASGLANSHDQVGRGYMCHRSQAVMALNSEPNPVTFQKTLGINDFYERGWGAIQMLGKSSADAIQGESRLAALTPHWPLEKVAAHALDFWLSTEDLPKPYNRVQLGQNGGVRLSVTQTSMHEMNLLYQATRRMLRDSGMHDVFLRKVMPLAAVAHQAGTCRFGTDPASSVLDVNCKAHELDNLYVVDTSFFPSIGAVNPALTAIANAIRVGEHLTERLG
jgi:choline dehydrogenase-like flavoprotein